MNALLGSGDLLQNNMAVLQKGKYLGKFKDGEIYYHSFEPEIIVENGKKLYVRIGDYQEEFPTGRPYMLHKINEEEKKLIGNETI